MMPLADSLPLIRDAAWPPPTILFRAMELLLGWSNLTDALSPILKVSHRNETRSEICFTVMSVAVSTRVAAPWLTQSTLACGSSVAATSARTRIGCHTSSEIRLYTLVCRKPLIALGRSFTTSPGHVLESRDSHPQL